MPKRTNLYLTDEALGILKRVSNASAFSSAAIVRAGRELHEARTLIRELMTRDELLAALDATNGLFIIEGMAYADQVAADVEDTALESKHLDAEGQRDLAERIYKDEGLARSLIRIRDAFFSGMDDLEWIS